jgi:hypothetical protein
MTVLIRHLRSGRYAEWVPWYGSFQWLAGLVTHATPLTPERAETVADHFRQHGDEVEVIPDPMEREPAA